MSLSKSKVLVGISGGVDSAVSAFLLQQQGYEVVGGFMINYMDLDDPGCHTRQDYEIAQQVCKYLGIGLETFDFRTEYHDRIIKYILDGYQSGITPNPDVLCNSLIKFDIFLEEAIQMGYDYISTGHYARIYRDTISDYHTYIYDKKNIEQGHIYSLYRGLDLRKDQSYFLSRLSQYQLAHSIFPLGNLQKSQVRDIAHQAGLPNADRPDSQGLCFIGDISIKSFLSKYIGPKEGDILDKHGSVIGKHQGAYMYTVGQRRGLGSLREKSYVISVDTVSNTVTVGGEDDMDIYICDIIGKDVCWIGYTPDWSSGHISCHAKIRYRQSETIACDIYIQPDSSIYIQLQTPIKGVAKGQFIVFYGGSDDMQVLGSAVIS